MKSTLLFLLLCVTFALPAQTFGPFFGHLLSIDRTPGVMISASNPVFPDTVGPIHFKALNFLPMELPDNFPGVTLPYGIAFHLKSQLTIDSSGCYAFALASDDGARLWIEDSLAIDNWGLHKWKVKRDTQQMERGKYRVRVHYFNAFVPAMGLALSGEPLPAAACRVTDTVRIAARALFRRDQSRLLPGAAAALDSLVAQLRPISDARISVVGHTDATGTAAYNLKLSTERAASVVRYLSSALGDSSSLTFVASGVGAAEPVSAVAAENRRVEVWIVRGE